MTDLNAIGNLIFDMDGTLADTAKISVAACQRFAPAFCLPPLDAAHIAGCIGYANPEFYWRLYPGYDRELLVSFAIAVEDAEKTLLQELGQDILFPGAAQALRALAARGRKLYVASTGSPEHVSATLAAGGITDLFESIHCGVPVKIDMVAGIVALDPDGGWAMIGDRFKDYEAGHENGVVTIAALFGYGPASETDRFDYAIESFADLLPLLGL